MQVEIIPQPYSGAYKEVIYDIENAWNSSSWTWVKFTNDDGNETVGQFRGAPITVQSSEVKKEIIVLTSDHVFRLNTTDLTLIETQSDTLYENVTVSPDGTFIFCDSFEVEKMNDSLSSMIVIEAPFKMHFIQFKKWKDHLLEFTCDNEENNYQSETHVLDTLQWKILSK